MVVTLDQSEINLLSMVGVLRNVATGMNAADMAQDTRTDGMQMSIIGTIGEYAVAKALNLNFDLNCAYRKFGADLISDKGNKIDVKSTTKPGGALNAVGWSDRKSADVYILTEVSLPNVKIVGWVARGDFLTTENVVTVAGRKPFYSMPQNKLTPIKPSSPPKGLPPQE